MNFFDVHLISSATQYSITVI